MLFLWINTGIGKERVQDIAGILTWVGAEGERRHGADKASLRAARGAPGDVERQQQPRLCPEMGALGFVQLHVKTLGFS